MVLSNWPSVYGWTTVLKCKVVPKVFQNHSSLFLVKSFIINNKSFIDPNQPKRMKVKTTTTHIEKGKWIASSGSQPLQTSKRPRSAPSGAPSVPQQQAPQLRNDLQRFRYDLFQGSKYNCGRQVEWSVYAQAISTLKSRNLLRTWVG